MIYNDEHFLDAFLHLKTEAEDEKDVKIDPALLYEKRLKLATLKVAETGQGNKYGEGLLKIAFDIARQSKAQYIYVTVFPKHTALINLMEQVGFERYGRKITDNGEEYVYIRRFAAQFDYNRPMAIYPRIPRNPERPVRIVPIEAEYHSLLFPASDLQGAIHQIDEYIPASNAIRKIYLARGQNAGYTNTGDLLLFYRIKHKEEIGQPKYKSAITTVGVVENVYREGPDFRGVEEFSKIAGKRTAFSPDDLIKQYKEGRRIIIQFLYMFSFGKGHNVNYQTLLDNEVINPDIYWGFLPIPNVKYQLILREARVDDSHFID